MIFFRGLQDMLDYTESDFSDIYDMNFQVDLLFCLDFQYFEGTFLCNTATGTVDNLK